MATIAGFDLYGGATITRVIDGAGAEWIGCTAKRLSDHRFVFTLFRNGVEVEYAPFCTARGTINQDGHWIAFNGSSYFTGAIPGFTPLPDMEARIAALEAHIAALPPTTTGSPLRVPPQKPPLEGGEIQLADGIGGPPWVIDVYSGVLRFIHDGVVIAQWPK